MKIIEHGTDNRKTFRFVCTRCGCVYEATEDEGDVRRGAATGQEFMILPCPELFCCTLNKGHVLPQEECGIVFVPVGYKREGL